MRVKVLKFFATIQSRIFWAFLFGPGSTLYLFCEKKAKKDADLVLNAGPISEHLLYVTKTPIHIH